MPKVSIQFGSINLSAEGEETFLKGVLADWKHLFQSEPPAAIAAPQPAVKSAPSPTNDPVILYENVFDRVDGKLKLIKHISGETKAERTRSTTLAVLYGHYLDGINQVPSEVVRDACSDQGCFDSKHFAEHVKALKEKVGVNAKSGGGYDIKLTAPGRTAAKEYVESINS